MKKSKYLSLLALSLLIVGCDGNATSSIVPSIGTSDGITSSIGTSDEIISSSEETTVVTQEVVNQTVGTADLLKGVLSSYKEKGITEIVTISNTKTSSKKVTTKLKSKEFYEETVTTPSSGSSTTSFDYTGFFNGIKYYVYDAGSYKSSSTEAVETDDMNDEIDMKKSSKIDLSSGIWRYFFTPTVTQEYGVEGTVIESYQATLQNETITIRAKASSKSYSGYTTKTFSGLYQYTLMASMDTSFNLINGTLSYNYYTAALCDEETMLPKDDATPILANSEEVESVTFDSVEESGSSIEDAMIEIEPYFVSSVSESAFITSRIYDESYMNSSISNVNEVFAGSTNIVVNLESSTGEKFYTPDTACNADEIKVVSSSSSVISKGDSGWEVSADESNIGTTVTLTVGNASNPNLRTIQVTVVANPFASGDSSGTKLPSFSFDDLPLSADGFGYFDEDEWAFVIGTMDEAIIAIPTTNSGPFDDYSEVWSIITENGDVFDARLDTTMSDLGDYVVIVISPKKLGSDILAIVDESETPIYSLYITITESIE